MCDLCGHNPCLKNCPNYTPPKVDAYCTVCGEGIYDGEEYIKNAQGEYRHWECFRGMRELVSWLGYDVKTMGD